MNVRDLVPWARGERESSAASRSEPLSPVFNLHREMNRIFDDVFRDFAGSPGSNFGVARSARPSMDVEETDKAYRITAELPGVEERDVELTYENGVLSIRGEKKLAKEDGNRTFSERYYGRFERQIALDREIDENAITATFRNGILTVTVPKSEQALERTKRIPINSGTTSH